jgi:hypothetical protein
MPARARREAAKSRHPRSPEPAVEAVVESHVDAERLLIVLSFR